MEGNNASSAKNTALACGITGLVLACISWFVLGFLSIFGLILGIVACVMASKSKKAGVPATGGLVCGILAIVFSGLALSCWICALAALSSASSLF